MNLIAQNRLLQESDLCSNNHFYHNILVNFDNLLFLKDPTPLSFEDGNDDLNVLVEYLFLLQQ